MLDVPAGPEAEEVPPVIPATPEDRLGFPKRSTPSFAAEIRADPSIEASKREGMDDVPLRPRPCDTELDAVVAGAACRAVSIGLLCWRLGA